MKKLFILLLVLVVASSLTSCATTPTRSRETEKRVFISKETEIRIGKDVAREVERRYKILNNPEVTQYVVEVGQKLVSVCNRKDIQYSFKVLDDKMINAFACPGGFIYISTGLLKMMHSEAELAAVLGHEIGHVNARHSMVQLQTQMIYGTLAEIFLGSGAARLVADITATMIIRGYGRSNELEADYLGLLFMHRAGYDPQGMVDLLSELQKKEKGKTSGLGSWFATHPPTADRIQAVRQELSAFPTTSGTYEKYEERFQEVLELLQ